MSRNCWPVVMQRTNLAGISFRNGRLVRIFACNKIVNRQFEIGKKHRVVFFFNSFIYRLIQKLKANFAVFPLWKFRAQKYLHEFGSPLPPHPPQSFRIPIKKNPSPFPWNSKVPPMVWYGIFWNHPSYV